MDSQLSAQNIVKIGLALLMLACLLDMPYGFFMIVRFATMAGMAFLAYDAYQSENIPLVIAFVSVGLLFQPFAKVPLGRELWNIVDVIVALALIVSVFYKNDKTT